MARIQEKLKAYFLSNPKHIFFVDGFGALISAFFLGFILIVYQPFIGMPISILYLLAALALIFAVFSFSSIYFKHQLIDRKLKIIFYANTLYILLTVFFMIFYFEKLTIIGLVYFIFEISIVWSLVKIERDLSNEIQPH